MLMPRHVWASEDHSLCRVGSFLTSFCGIKLKSSPPCESLYLLSRLVGTTSRKCLDVNINLTPVSLEHLCQVQIASKFLSWLGTSFSVVTENVFRIKTDSLGWN